MPPVGHAPVISRMHKNAPFRDKNSTNFLRRGHSPPRGDTPSQTPPLLPPPRSPTLDPPLEYSYQPQNVSEYFISVTRNLLAHHFLWKSVRSFFGNLVRRQTIQPKSEKITSFGGDDNILINCITVSWVRSIHPRVGLKIFIHQKLVAREKIK